jgi:hypothetical protein
MSQDVCPWNVRFSAELPDDSPFAPRAALGTDDRGVKDARTLARELLAMSQAEFSVAFRGSPMKRAKRRGLARNAAVALGNVGTADDLPALEVALAHDEPLVREHAAWALDRLARTSRSSREEPASAFTLVRDRPSSRGTGRTHQFGASAAGGAGASTRRTGRPPTFSSGA